MTPPRKRRPVRGRQRTQVFRTGAAPGPRPPTFFVTTVPGLGELAAREVDSVDGVASQRRGNDGRADVIGVGVRDPKVSPSALALGTVEDVFVTVAVARTTEPLVLVAAGLLSERRLAQALLVRDRLRGHTLRRRASVRVIARLRDERRFRRTQLRDALRRRAHELRPDWRVGDPADIELWALQWQPDEIICGVRVSDARMRHGDGREEERPGALRPVVARAMLSLAGPPGRLLDPCCGSGTILREGAAGGWRPVGFDIAPRAVDAARSNVPGADVEVGDVRDLPLGDGSVGAVVTNLPFGTQYGVQGDSERWMVAAVGELARVTRVGGPIVLLHPDPPPAPDGLEVTRQARIRLLGRQASIWLLQRRT